MADYLKEYKFENPPKTITYSNEEPLSLSSDFSFYHNKSKFRKELNRLQNLFKKYLNTPLTAAGIRDSYLKQEYSEKFFIILFATAETVKETNLIIDKHSKNDIHSSCFFLKSNSKYLLLLAVDMEGLYSGIDLMEEIFRQTFEDYFVRKQFDEYVKIRPFEISGCRHQ